MPRVEPPAGGHVNVEAVASAVRSKDSRVRVAVAEVAVAVAEVAVSVSVAVAVRISVEADVTRLLCELKVEISLRQHPRPPGTPRRRTYSAVSVAVAVRISVADVTRLLCELKVEVSLRQHPRPPGTPRRRCRGLRHINPRQIHAEPEPRCVDVPRTRRSVTSLISVKKALGRRKN